MEQATTSSTGCTAEPVDPQVESLACMNAPQPKLNRRILIIDDTPSIHADFRKILERVKPEAGPSTMADPSAETALFEPESNDIEPHPGFELTSAFQGQEGLVAVQEALRLNQPFAVAFVDMRMPPGWDGLETVVRLWQADPDLQVILCTAYSDYSWEQVIDHLGTTDRLVILNKPFDVIEVRQLSHALTQKWQRLQQTRRHVTELERTLESRTHELKCGHAQLEHLLHCSSAVIYSINICPLGGVSFVSDNITTLSGHEPMEFKADPYFWIEHVHPEDVATMRATIVRLLKTGHEIIEYRLRNRNGQYRWLRDEAHVHRSEDGTTAQVVGSLVDVTGRREAEVSLRASEQRLRLALKAGGLGVFEFNFSQERVVVSPDFCQIFEFPLQTSISIVEWGERAHRDDRDSVMAGVRRLLTEQSGLDLEYQLCLPDGTIRWIRLMACPVVEHGKVERAHGVVQDITKRKQAESGLRKLSRAVEQSPASIVITDIDGSIEYVNPKFCSVTGYTFQEVSGTNPRLLKSGEMPTEAYRQLWATITSGEEWQGEFHNRKKNGELFWESASISPIRNGNGSVTHFVAVKEDITRRKETEAALKESEENYRALFDRSLDCVFVHDFEGRFLDLNAAAFTLLGHQREELASLTFDSVLIPDDVPRARRMIEEVRATGTHTELMEFTARRKDGSYVDLETKSSLVMREGKAHSILAVARDITQRKLADQALKEQLALREWLAKIAANAPGIIYTFRLRPDGSSCIPYASPTIESLWGIKSEDLANDSVTFFNLVHPDDQLGFRESIAESARGMSPWRLEFRLRSATQGMIWVEGQSTPDREADGSIIWHGFLSDITERKRTADQLTEHIKNQERVRRDLENERELNKIKSRFVNMVSHEFRTPLCLIGMAGSLLGEYSERMTAEERSQQILGIRTAVEHMTQMMEDLLLHGEFEAGKIQCKPSHVNVRALCQELISDASKHSSIPRAVNCVVDAHANTAFLDEKVLRHVLGNLLSNAIKYSPEGQPVTVEITRVAATPASTEDAQNARNAQIQLRIGDLGIGIPKSDLSRLFQTFQRASNVGNRPGTGMGLAIVKQFVDLHRGTIRVESEEGKGTTVWVCLPAFTEDARVGPPNSQEVAFPVAERAAGEAEITQDMAVTN